MNLVRQHARHEDGAQPGGGTVIERVDGPPPADRRSAFSNAPMGIALTTVEGVLVDANAALCTMLRRTADELYGRSVRDLVQAEGVTAAREAYQRPVEPRARPMRHEPRLRRAEGTDVPVQVTASRVEETEGQSAHLVMIVEDITERKALEAALVHRSLHDPLTGLPNRLLFQDRLWHALERGRRENTPTCVLIADLDGFKAINDELGHPMGDLVLVT